MIVITTNTRSIICAPKATAYNSSNLFLAQAKGSSFEKKMPVGELVHIAGVWYDCMQPRQLLSRFRFMSKITWETSVLSLSWFLCHILGHLYSTLIKVTASNIKFSRISLENKWVIMRAVPIESNNLSYQLTGLKNKFDIFKAKMY